MKNITEFAVKNWQFTMIVFLMILVIGINSLLTMPRNEDPETNPVFFPIAIVYPGTTPKDMETLTVDPIEKAMSELDDVDNITTTIEDGLATIMVEFRHGVDRDMKYQDVVRELDRLRESLPEDIASMEILNYSPSDVNILQISLISDRTDFETLNTLSEDLQKRLEKIKNLKSVEYWGCPERIIRISLDTERLSQLKLTSNQIYNILQGENLNIPSGSVNIGDKRFNIQTKGEYKNLEEIKNTVIRTSDGKTLYLKDVATIDYSYDEATHICRTNGQRAVFVTACLKPGENISAVRDIYTPIIDEFAQTLPENVTLIKNFDQAVNVSNRLSRLGVDFSLAILIVLLTILPIGRRASYIVMLSIPLSLAIGLSLLALFGYSINQLSIVGLVVSLTILIDDSIIVIENIERWRREGASKIDAAIKGTKQITMAVIGCTLLLAVAFAPIALMPGTAGEFIRSLPLAIIFTVMASLLVSLTIIPFLSTLILKEETNPEGNKLLVLLKKGISKTYGSVLTKALANPKKTMLVTALLFIGAIMLVPKLGFQLFPKSEKPQFQINIEAEQGSNIESTNKITQEVEKILAQNPLVKYYSSNVGRGNPRIYYAEVQRNSSPRYAQIFVQLHEEVSPEEKTELIDKLRDTYKGFPNASVKVKDFEQGSGGQTPIGVRLYNENLDSLQAHSVEVENFLEQIEGVIYIDNPLKYKKTDIQLKINRDKAAMMGVLNSDIERAVRMALVGLEIGILTDDYGNDYTIKLTTPKSQAADYNTLKNIYVTSLAGTAIPITAFADIEFGLSPVQINHRDKGRFTTISADIQSGYLASAINNELDEKLSKADFLNSSRYSLAGERETTSRSFSGFGAVVLIALACFIGILILEFKTFKSLLIVLSVIPLGIIGAVLMLLFAGQPLSFVSIIGFIALIGLEVKNSILIVDFINQLRREGMQLEQAIIEAGEIRFVPILMTASTAILGLLPLVIEFNPLYSPLALVIIGGLLTSTFLSRIVTPVMYKLLPPKIEEI